ncbi:MAG: lytic transglycosylase domain-containing protein [bacterium]|nr:lytic transglycosylase domain-containing protein [bacterium]
MVIATAALMVAVIDLAEQKRVNGETIATLNKQMANLLDAVSHYKALEKQQEQERNFREFKESVFQLKYPKFLKTATVVFEKSQEYGFNPYLVMGLVQVESGFNQYAVSTAGAYGLMQVNYSVWKDEMDIDFSKIFDREYNVDLGLKILKHYHNKASGNMLAALFRYNNGYKYNNTAYSGKIIATRFYSHRDRMAKVQRSSDRPKNVSI